MLQKQQKADKCADMCCGQKAEYGWWTRRKWAKTAHYTHKNISSQWWCTNRSGPTARSEPVGAKQSATPSRTRSNDNSVVNKQGCYFKSRTNSATFQESIDFSPQIFGIKIYTVGNKVNCFTNCTCNCNPPLAATGHNWPVIRISIHLNLGWNESKIRQNNRINNCREKTMTSLPQQTEFDDSSQTYCFLPDFSRPFLNSLTYQIFAFSRKVADQNKQI